MLKTYVSHQLRLSQKRVRVCKSLPYHDRVDESVHNRTFFVFSIGRFNNTPIYHYGETSDIALEEFRIRRALPFYEKVLDVPLVMDGTIRSKEEFDTFIREHDMATKIPLSGLEDWGAFTTPDLHPIMAFWKVPEFGKIDPKKRLT